MENIVEKVKPEFAHKVNPDNVLIEKVECKDIEKGEFYGKLIINREHMFFYDYPFEVDHIPGIVLIEAVKQMSCVVAHHFWKIPMTYAFAPLVAESRFSQFVEFDPAPEFISNITYKSVLKGAYFANMETKVLQKGKKRGILKSKFIFLKPELYKTVRNTGNFLAVVGIKSVKELGVRFF